MNKLLYRTTGRYYLGESAEQAQYVFQLREDAPKDLKRGFVIELEKDEHFTGSALTVAHEIKRIIDSYWISTEKPKIQKLVDYLEKWEEKDDYDYLLARREELTKNLEAVNESLAQYDHEEMRNWKPDLVEEDERNVPERTAIEEGIRRFGRND